MIIANTHAHHVDVIYLCLTTWLGGCVCINKLHAKLHTSGGPR